MTLDKARLQSVSIPEHARPLTDRDAILYALSVGLGAAPDELGFVYEKALRPVPSMATVLAYEDSWLAPAGVDLAQVFHASQRLVFHAPLPAAGTVRATNAIAGLIDKGAGKPALILQQGKLFAEGASEPCVTSLSTLFVRGGGGFGGSTAEAPAPIAIPEREPDLDFDIPTRPEQAMMFRLLGDRNPLHIDPDAAAAAGFDRPILHGACTFGIACAALLRRLCGLDPDRLREMEARFVGPVLPGETLNMRLWTDGGDAFFQVRSVERDMPVLDAGHARIGT